MLFGKYLLNFFKLHYILIFFVLTLTSCIQNINSKDSKQLSSYDKNIIESMFVKLDFYYASNPDSAIILANQFEKQLTELKEWYYLIDLYNFLGELYQFRKKDIPKAMTNFLNALEVKDRIENFNISYLNSYFFYSNIGNILYNFEFYDDALEVYKEAYELAKKDTAQEALVVILNNIALSHFQLNNCESAYTHFLKAKNHINNRVHIFNAQHYYYLSILSFKCGYNNVMPFLFKKGMSHLEDFKKNVFKNDMLYLDKETVDYYNFNAKLFLNLAKYYTLKKEKQKALKNYEKALYFANIERNEMLKAEILMYCSQLHFEEGNFINAIEKAKQALKLHDNFNDFKGIIKIHTFLSMAYASIGKSNEAKTYNSLSKAYADSLSIYEYNYEMERKKTILAKTGLLLGLQNLKEEKEKITKTVYNQKTTIIILGVLLGVMFIIITYKRFKSKRKKHTDHFLTKTEHETINAAKKEKEHERMKCKLDGLLVQLETLMLTEKLYLNDGLKLNDLAITLKTNQAYLSQLINTHYGMSYKEYINRFRIKEACLLIQNNSDKSFTIDHLYSKLGYKSKSTFYTAFKKETGFTPAEYIKIYKKVF